jgi:ribonucleoside-triphosphate reductase
MARQETKQLTFDGITVPVLPSVRTSDGHIIEWNRERIVRQIVEETKLVETFYGYEGADEEIGRAHV